MCVQEAAHVPAFMQASIVSELPSPHAASL